MYLCTKKCVMTTFTIKINENTKAGKTFLSILHFFISEKKGVEIVEEKSTYDPKFVKEILDASKSKGKAIKTEDIWK